MLHVHPILSEKSHLVPCGRVPGSVKYRRIPIFINVKTYIEIPLVFAYVYFSVATTLILEIMKVPLRGNVKDC